MGVEVDAYHIGLEIVKTEYGIKIFDFLKLNLKTVFLRYRSNMV